MTAISVLNKKNLTGNAGMPDLEKDMQKKEKDSRSKDEPVSDCFWENEKEKKNKDWLLLTADSKTDAVHYNNCKANSVLELFPLFQGTLVILQQFTIRN